MARIFTLLLYFVIFFPVAGQKPGDDRCKTTRTEDADRFERWVKSTQIRSAFETSSVQRIPVVVHVIHTGEALGEGFNYSDERIVGQIRTLNEDFRRKSGTPGFNAHPDGDDARIEFVLAQIDPEGHPTNGIVRVDRNEIHPPPGISDFLTLSSSYSYWDPEKYLNIWCWDVGLHGIYAGKSRFPVSDLEGLSTENDDSLADGIFINAINFGQGDTNTIPNLDMGRTLTHEMGHFLGLLHTFGPPGSCDYSDYCDDTPPISNATSGCPSERPLACDGRPAMIENYMDYSYDRCMNIFTKDQTARMRIVLEGSPRRKSLSTSAVIDRSGEVITGSPDKGVSGISVYPNPVTNKMIYVSVDERFQGYDVTVTAHAISGKMIFQKTRTLSNTSFEISVSELNERVVLLTIEAAGVSTRRLMVIN